MSGHATSSATEATLVHVCSCLSAYVYVFPVHVRGRCLFLRTEVSRFRLSAAESRDYCTRTDVTMVTYKFIYFKSRINGFKSAINN